MRTGQTIQTDSWEERKKRYHALLRTVGHQSSPEQLPGVRPETLTLILAGHSRHSPDGVDLSLQAAVENKDLFTWFDTAGRRRVTLATMGDPQRLSVYVAEEMRDTTLLVRVNRAIAEVRA